MQSGNNKTLHIIGSGPVGLNCAILAQSLGFSVKIITLPFNLSGHFASLAAGGMLAPSYECLCQTPDHLTDLAYKSRDAWDILAQKYDIEIKKIGLALGQTEADYEFLERQRIDAKRFDKDIEFIKVPSEINAKYALHLKPDGLLNPHEVLPKLVNVFTENGGEIIFDEVLKIDEKNIITKNSGNIKFDRLIIAAGFESHMFSDFLPVLENLRPVKGQVIEIDVKAPVEGSARYETTYIMSRGGKTIVGATAHFDKGDWELSEEDKKTLFNDCAKLYPNILDKKITNSFVGVRPSTIDEMPILGQSHYNNIYFACGAYRNGWLLAPQISKLVINNLVENSNIIEEFSAKRFDK